MEMHTIESLRATHRLFVDTPPKRVIRPKMLGLLPRAWRAYQHNRGLARATEALARLDDRLLRDIGISRCDIYSAVRYAVDRR